MKSSERSIWGYAPQQPLHREHTEPNDEFLQSLRCALADQGDPLLQDATTTLATTTDGTGGRSTMADRATMSSIGELLQATATGFDGFTSMQKEVGDATAEKLQRSSMQTEDPAKSLQMRSVDDATGKLLHRTSGDIPSAAPDSGRRPSQGTPNRNSLDSSEQEMQHQISGMEVGHLRSSGAVMPSEGRLEDKYSLQRKLGKGAFGEVSLATCKATGEKRAVKSVNIATSWGFQNEFRIAKKVKQENIVQLHDMFLHDDQCFLVMDMCSGGDLGGFIRSRYHFTFDKKLLYTPPLHYEVAPVMWQMLQAIRYLHFHSIVHRDIKIDNFLFDSCRDWAPIKLIDFGLAANMKKGFLLIGCVGTFGYHAPEVLKGNGYNELVDIWSIGVVSFLLCVGEFPIDITEDIGNDAEAMLKVTNEAVIDFDKLKQNSFPDDVSDVLRKMLDLDPSVRPAAKHILSTNTWMRKHGRATSRPGCCARF